MKTREFLVLVRLKRADECRGCPCLQKNISGLNECNLGHSDIHPPCAASNHGKIEHGIVRPQDCINAAKNSEIVQIGIM